MAKEETFMVIATLYEAPKHNDEYMKEFKIVTHKATAVQRKYAKDFNERAEQSGKWYEFDEEATSEFYANRKMAKMDRDKADELTKDAGDMIVGAVKAIKKTRKTKAKSQD